MNKYIIIFLIYSFIGCVLEHISYYIGNNLFDSKPKTLSNPIMTGFPLYGLGGLLIYYIYNKYLRGYHWTILFLIFGSVITLIEYSVGKYLVNAGQYSGDLVDSWNYTNEPFNYKGIISLRHFISWGILGLLIVKIQPKLEEKLKCLEE